MVHIGAIGGMFCDTSVQDMEGFFDFFWASKTHGLISRCHFLDLPTSLSSHNSDIPSPILKINIELRAEVNQDIFGSMDNIGRFLLLCSRKPEPPE